MGPLRLDAAGQAGTGVFLNRATLLAPQERHELIAEAAYFIAARRGFASGSELDDWIQAKAEVARRLGDMPSDHS